MSRFSGLNSRPHSGQVLIGSVPGRMRFFALSACRRQLSEQYTRFPVFGKSMPHHGHVAMMISTRRALILLLPCASNMAMYRP